MGVYAITGARIGIGAACAKMLEEQGHKVIKISRGEGADIRADLSKKEDRQRAVKEIEEIAPDGLDGFVANSGVGPTEPGDLILRLNYFGAKDMIEDLFPLLQKKNGVVLAVSSNSANLPGLNTELVDMLCDDDDEEAAAAYGKTLEGANKQEAYQASKFGLAKWVRRNSAFYVTKGVRMNAIAPGATWTNLMEVGFDDDVFGDSMQSFPVPSHYNDGKVLSPEDVANTMIFLLSPESVGICGAVIYTDGGTDAFLRTERF